MPPVHELTRSSQTGNAIDGTRAVEAAPCADIMHSGYHERQAQQGARERVHRDQHSTIQMDRLNNKYRPRSDTHHFDPTLSSSGCRPRGRCASAPPGQSCAVRQRIRLWQRRGAARRSRPSVWEERPLLRRESIGMILAFSYINLVQSTGQRLTCFLR